MKAFFNDENRIQAGRVKEHRWRAGCRTPRLGLSRGLRCPETPLPPGRRCRNANEKRDARPLSPLRSADQPVGAGRAQSPAAPAPRSRDSPCAHELPMLGTTPRKQERKACGSLFTTLESSLTILRREPSLNRRLGVQLKSCGSFHAASRSLAVQRPSKLPSCF